MPELPEVQTTVNGLRDNVIGLRIMDVWTSYNSAYFKGSETIKDPSYYSFFKREVVGRKIISVGRRAKNILINLSGGRTILIHMKMTGHLLFGKYARVSDNIDRWEPVSPDSLKDPYNLHIRLVFTFSNEHHLALADVRRFAKVAVLPTEAVHSSPHLSDIGPEPLDPDFTLTRFTKQLAMRPSGKVKQVLTDQSIVAGIGNIYADESLWRAGIHPMEKVTDIPPDLMKKLYSAVRSTLAKGIDFGGDSMSDYRNIRGEKGLFQEHHHAYRKKGQRCDKKGCTGTISRIVVGGRSTHYCPVHQVLRNSKRAYK